mmetsp:Transcript_1638/g.3510  ORF Transcript_1638/g.3510 Transcript_1638/m.3510 type:complete len:90 (-) Transcript_1638:272-541(-)|eukprot:CAMPEP_0119542716 /NCGR_PEP_ID=MMETSP1344-20130328/53737_1 /TAXON_ID=236787 /ORGANISM="Florenciella parvula, Strain CCMP2471" /LENGTH=89 /DNA_ID=CAMNT_0007586965 /DNA_START=324 /DNA_END=593 /DNA_ORIENTATION=-
MATSATTLKQNEVAAIQKDWKNREFVEVVKLNMLQIVQFLNNFDSSARYKLSCINEKLHSLERMLEFCEAAVQTSTSLSEAADEMPKEE